MDMSDEPTRTLTDGLSFEERVLASLNAIDARLDAVDARLQTLEDQSERRAMETKLIWERALAEILEVKQGLANVERKIDVLSRDIVQVRADQAHVESRLDKLETKPVQ
jgi:chromosome segregation ATPase